MADTLSAVVGGLSALGGALITAGPAYIAARNARRAARRVENAATTEGEATRGAIHSGIDLLSATIDGRLLELRNEIRETRDWQTSHTAEHMLLSRRDDEG